MDAVVGYCHENDKLVIVDEVQTGVGRTGTLYCFEQFGFLPDIVTSPQRGWGGGLPFGAILFAEKTAGALVPGDHATTFGGNPIAAAGSVAILKRMTKEFLQEVTQKGAYLREKLAAMPHVTQVAGLWHDDRSGS